MANLVTTTYLSDNKKTIWIKIVGELDSVQNNVVIVEGSKIPGALDTTGNVLAVSAGTPKSAYKYSVKRIVYSVANVVGYLKLNWDGSTRESLITLNGSGDTNGDAAIPVLKQNTAIATGNISASIVGATPANSAYTLIMEVHKDLTDYDSGAKSSPAYFNAPPFGVTP